jgi:hypothetical protein
LSDSELRKSCDLDLILKMKRRRWNRACGQS